jgi:hypothetical protein
MIAPRRLTRGAPGAIRRREAMQRPIGIYASTLSRRDLARRRARMRGPWRLRARWWGPGLVVAAVVVERVLA